MDFANLLASVPDIGDKQAREMTIARLAAAGGAANERAKWRARMVPLNGGQITDAIVQGMRDPVLMRLTGEQVREFVRVIELAHGIEGPNVGAKEGPTARADVGK